MAALAPPTAAHGPSYSLQRFSFLATSFLLLLLVGAFQPAAAARPNPQWNIIPASDPWKLNATLEYYVHVRTGDVDVGYLIPAINPNLTNAFGSTQLFAFNVTQGSDPQSTQLGFVRGYTVQASYVPTAIGVEVESVSYDDGSLSGTIQLQGIITTAANEIAVVGGTGDFRGVRGYGIITQVSASSDGKTFVYHHQLHFL